MTIRMELGERSYPIYLESGALGKAGELFDLGRKVLIVTDGGVPPEYARTVAKAAEDPVLVTVPAGEGSKSFDKLEELLGAMLEHGFTRHDCAVAVGGGVVGDLTGFAASLYMRGIDFYNIPTTLLSEVDSSIGGKTAVDFRGTKNTVGTFWQPKAVLIDPAALATLPRRQLSAGMAEALKMSLTSDAELFRVFEEEDPFLCLPRVIEGALRIKKAVVEADEREAGLRKILNFGHTLGHAIESVLSPDLLHGECVALGMLPMCSEDLRRRLIPIYEKLGLPSSVSAPSYAIREAMLHDKKSGKGGIDAVFVDEPGTCRIGTESADALIQRYESVFGRKR